MWLFDWLFKRKDGTTVDHAAGHNRDQDERFIDLPTCRFFGPSKSSPNGRFRIAWDSGEAGAETRKSGRYLLLDGEKIIVEGKMARPSHGAVANNGTFILIDDKQLAELSGALFAFDAHGSQLIARHFKANVFSCGISDDGRLAVCQTCNSSDENDSSILAVFDLSIGRELSTLTPELGWTTDYKFSTDGKTVGLHYRALGTFYYSLSGEFIDRSKWQDTCLTKGDYGTAIMMAEGLIKSAGGEMSSTLCSKIISCIGRITPQLEKADKQWQALAYKVHGICLEASGAPTDALVCYEKALALNPKVGVKRRADQLRKAMTLHGIKS